MKLNTIPDYRNSDSAKGPAAGYIYQFEVALLEILNLNEKETISIEKTDDIAKQGEDDTYIFTIQAKYSITSTGSPLGSVSADLWKTMKIWIEKLNKGILFEGNVFIAITNKQIPKNSIVRLFKKESSERIIEKIKDIKKNQQKKYEEKVAKNEKGTSIKKVLELIDIALSNEDKLKIIFDNFQLRELEDVKHTVISKLLLSTSSKNVQDEFYQRLLGWLIDTSKELWLDGKDAIFSHEDLEIKFNLLRDSHSIIKAIFRNKKELLKNNPLDPAGINNGDFYIKQIDDIEREFKDEIISDATIDFFLRDIEVSYLITNRLGNSITKSDFEDFEEKCLESWNKIKRKHITKKIALCSTEELNEIAIRIYDEIMQDLKLGFQEINIDDSSRYIQNGTFLHLSNLPTIGWHPEWNTKYKSSNG